MNNTTWILVADSIQAKIYKTHKARLFLGNGNKLALVDTLTHEESKKPDRDIASDRQGKFGNGTFVEHTDPHRYEEERFAMELAKKLNKARSENHYHDLIFVAPAAFMGMINQHISQEVGKLVSLKIEKDYTKKNERELVECLQGYL